MAKQTAPLQNDVPGRRSLGFWALCSHQFTSKLFNLSPGTRGEARCDRKGKNERESEILRRRRKEEITPHRWAIRFSNEVV